MNRIRITQFGGLSPSTDPRNLPEDGAQIAQNLDMRFGDFRPANGLGVQVASVPAGTQSMFRTPSGTWLHSPTDADFVNAPVADAERVYVTGRSAYPEAWQGGTYRKLGVPAAVSKPLATVVVVDEFDSGDAATATEAATVAVLNAIYAVDSPQLMGNPVVGLGAPGEYDPLYPKVQLHLKFNATPFVDSSPQRRAVTTESGVAYLNDNSGPLGASGAGCGDFNGGAGVGGLTFQEIRRWGTEADRSWTVDMWLTSDEELPELLIEGWRGAGDDFDNPNMRKLAFIRADGVQRTVMHNVNGSFTTALRTRRLDGTPVLAAGVATHIALQQTQSGALQVFVDGTLIGSTPYRLGLEFSIFGRASNVGTEAFLGKVDELRVTFAERYSGNFVRPTGPYPTLAVPTGYFVAHGEPGYVGLPTVSSEDAAYLVQLAASGGGWAAANPANEYLRAMPGAQVSFGGNQFWAVRVAGWRGTGLTTSAAAIEAAIAAVDNPATVPVDTLLTPAQAASLAPLLYAAYDPTKNPVASLVAEINAAQAALQAQLAATPGSATEVTSKLSLLASASASLEAHFNAIGSLLRATLKANASDVFGAISSITVTRNVETRAYVVTYVTDWGEESAPSPATDLLTLDQNDHVQITCPAPASGRYIVGWRLYRSSTTDRGAAFQLVDGTGATNAVIQDGAFAYFDVNVRSYLDVAVQEQLQEPLKTLTWIEPPAALKGLVALPNGVLAGFFDKTVCFCEPYAGYAWPIEYQHTVKYRVVGLSVYGQTVVVLTEGHPYFFSGADSANMSGQEVEVPQSCVAKRTIAAADGGVIYASPDGLCLAGPSGVEVLTTQAFSKADWQGLNVSQAFGAFSDGRYFLFVRDGAVTAANTYYKFDTLARRLSRGAQTPWMTAVHSSLLEDQIYVAIGAGTGGGGGSAGGGVNTVAYSSLTGVTAIDFSGITCPGTEPAAPPDSIGCTLEGVQRFGAAVFGERFFGHAVGSDASQRDVLSGSPTSPLALAAGPVDNNLVAVEVNGSITVAGMGVAGSFGGAPLTEAVGEGAVSILFDGDQSKIGFQVHAGSNAGVMYVSFFRADGSLIEMKTLNGLRNANPVLPVGFAFERAGGVKDIAGISLWNADSGGVSFDGFVHDVETPRVTDAGVFPVEAGAVSTAIWKSKLFTSSWPEGFGWAQVEGPLSSGVVLRLHLDGVLVYTTPALTSNKPVRLPAKKGRRVEIEIESTSRVTGIAIGQASEELL